MNILLIKTSSMGDLIHTFPALTDLQQYYPDVKVDWVVEENFQEIPQWHSAIRDVIPVAMRRWRNNILQHTNEYQAFYHALRAHDYDAVIDAQGLMKSALITRLAKTSQRIGFATPRESLAKFAYQQKIAVDMTLHAVEKLRILLSSAFDYTFDATNLNYGIDARTFSQNTTAIGDQTTKPYLLFLHATTWNTKHWPEPYWKALIALAVANGFTVKIPWSNPQEHSRAVEIAGIHAGKQAIILPRLSLTQIANVIANAHAVVAVDTGLAHVAAALNVPTVSMYGPTDPKRTGTYEIQNTSTTAPRQQHIAAHFHCSPCLLRECTYAKTSAIHPPCFETVTPEMVWEALRKIMN